MIARLREALAERYLIEDELGAGGMATVYRAEDLKHKRKVAVKVLRPELAAVVGAERFLAEIETTAALQHPHILPLFDSGEAAGTVFYVMPFVEGESLRERLDREKELPVDEAVRIAREVADALDYAHRKGVVHRDVKPENVLLHDGRALVADFGIALAVNSAGGERLTETGLSIGTPSYMSPEQAAGDRSVDGRTDVYALGCLTYEMLAGQPPYTGASAQAVLARVLTADPEPLSRHRPKVPGSVEHAVHAALSRIPADRPSTPAEFAELLTAPVAASRGVPTGPAPRRGWTLGLGSGLLLGALGGWLASALTTRPATLRGPLVEEREQLTFNGRSARPAIAPDGDWVAFVEGRCEVVRLFRCRYDLRAQEVGSTESLALIEDALSLESPRWTHDGSTVVVAGRLDEERDGVFGVPQLGGAVRYVGPPGVVETHPAGDTVLVVPERVRTAGEGGTALVIALADGAVVDTLPLPSSSVEDLAWSPDGGRIALSDASGDLTLLTRDGDVLSTRPTAGGRGFIRWTPDGTGLVYFEVGSVKSDRLVRLGVTPDGTFDVSPTVLISRIRTLYLGELDLARRSGRLAVATGDAIDDLWAVDLTTGPPEARQVARGTTWYGNPGLSPDGGTLYYLRGDALGDNVYALDLESGEEEALTAQPLPGGNEVRISADGRRLAFSLSGPDRSRLQIVEFPSRRRTSRPVEADPIGQPVPLEGGGLVAWSPLPPPGRLVLLDSLQGAVRTPDLPPLAERSFSPSPGGDRVALVTPDTTGRLHLWVASLPAGGDAVGRLLEGDLGTPGVVWTADGSIRLIRWLEGDASPSLWAAEADGGPPRRLTDIPVPCDPLFLHVSLDAERVACRLSDYRSDIWWIDGLGL